MDKNLFDIGKGVPTSGIVTTDTMRPLDAAKTIEHIAKSSIGSEGSEGSVDAVPAGVVRYLSIDVFNTVTSQGVHISFKGGRYETKNLLEQEFLEQFVENGMIVKKEA